MNNLLRFSGKTSYVLIILVTLNRYQDLFISFFVKEYTHVIANQYISTILFDKRKKFLFTPERRARHANFIEKKKNFRSNRNILYNYKFLLQNQSVHICVIQIQADLIRYVFYFTLALSCHPVLFCCKFNEEVWQLSRINWDACDNLISVFGFFLLLMCIV